ncbi:MAG: hypothetical protein ABJZ55_15035 [Fuerstiella sp.]
MAANTGIPSPNSIYFRFIGRRLRTLIAVTAGFFLMGVTVGVPHVQWTYSYSPTIRGTPSADEKQAAWYLSVTGWQYVSRAKYGPLTFIQFIPLSECFGSDNSTTQTR